MYIKVTDGMACFPTHILACSVPDDKRRDVPFQTEPDGVVCYADEERQRAETLLKSLNIAYVVQPQTPDQTYVTKARGVNYASRTEALNHLLSDGDVLSQRYQKLLDQLAKHAADIDDLKKHIKP